MRKVPKKQSSKADVSSELLKGWQEIASFLGQPIAVAQRWAKDGMPVKREGRFVTTSASELNQWLGKQSGEPVHVTTEKTDLAADLKRGLSYIRQQRKDKR